MAKLSISYKLKNIIESIEDHAAAGDPMTAPNILAGLATHDDPSIVKKVAGNANTPISSLQQIARSTGEHDNEIYNNPVFLMHILENPHPELAPSSGRQLSPEEALQRHITLTLHDNVLNSDDDLPRHVTPEALEQLADTNSGRAKIKIAKHDNSSPTLLGKLAKHPDHFVRSGVANNFNTPPESLKGLLTDENWRVAENAARNFMTPKESLDNVARNTSNPHILAALMLNHNLQAYAIRHIYNHRKNTISRGQFLSARNVPSDVAIGSLKQNLDPALTALNNNYLPAEAVQHIFNNLHTIDDDNYKLKILRNIAMHPNTNTQILDQLSDHNNPVVRANVARQEKLSHEARQKLKKDPDDMVAYNARIFEKK